MSHGLAPVRGQWAPHSAQSLLLLGIFTFIWVFILAILVAQSALRSVTRPDAAPIVKKSNLSSRPALHRRAPAPAALAPTSPLPTEPALKDNSAVTGGLESVSGQSVASPQATLDAHEPSATPEAQPSAHRAPNPYSAGGERRVVYPPTKERRAPEVATVVRDVRDTRPSSPVVDDRPVPKIEPLPQKPESAPARVNAPSSPEPARKTPTTPASADIF